ncbi:DUF1223 domain-containing protein [Aestuariivirga litoralis]|uniref:DUF1223 domain-containing protein n=1 Tax=Aestuariivirga litoralis TaxID=2650924 RepID=A0A2W2AS51_9HYPH|nr:DUF1223 domain-containing protein [Aestuariivirga litoralis]PZF78161.1 DUF1223 domain-containing protein [Aestuariivirga litoralis]
MSDVLSISRRQCLALGAGASIVCLAGRAEAVEPIDVVVELFSSQGCNSCPPGDRLLAELRDKPGVLALTFHVDYWDYLGWKDTLAGPDFSQRQYDYAKARGDMDVYTPQMIVNGSKQMVGSQRSEVFAVLDQSREKTWPVPVSINDRGRELVIDVGAGQGEATLWVMPILDHVSVKIEKGEMAGREVSYTNVVRKLVPAAMWKGAPASVSLPKDGLLTHDATGCVALLQSGKVGPVLGVSAWGRLTS